MYQPKIEIVTIDQKEKFNYMLANKNDFNNKVT